MENNLKLFDDFDRTDLNPSTRTEPYWVYLNQTARPQFQYVRELLQMWFDNYDAPSDKRENLCQAFRLKEDKAHLSAFFEIYLYQLFKAQGFKIEIEPEMNGKRPDFLLTAPNGEVMLLEATVAFSEREFGTYSAQEANIIDYLDKNLNSPDFFIQINIEKYGKQTPSHKRISNHVRQFLGTLDYENLIVAVASNPDNVLDNLPTTSWENDGWSIDFTFIPKKRDARGKENVRPVGLQFYGWSAVTTDNIKNSIRAKYSHYGELDIPYLLALNVLDPYIDDEDIAAALFGQESILIDFDKNTETPSRISNGALYTNNQWHKKRLSGISVFRNLYPHNIYNINPIIWHHPYCDKKLNYDLFLISQAIPDMQTHSSPIYHQKTPAELLKIDVDRMK